MRTKNGKKDWSGANCSLVAVFALAALLSAGLLLAPQGAQAQAGGIPDQTIDVGESGALVTDADVQAALGLTQAIIEEGGTVTYVIASDQDGWGDGISDETDDNGNIEVTGSDNSEGNVLGVNRSTGAISIGTPPDQDMQDMAEQADNTAKITVTADRDANGTVTAIDKEISFDLTVVQDPFQQDGVPVTTPREWSDTGACFVQTDGAVPPVLTSRNNINNPPAMTSIADATVLVSGGSCTTAEASVDVLFRNDHLTGARGFLVYMSGGNDFRNVDGHMGKTGLTEHTVSVPGQTVLQAPGEAKITVTRSAADSKNQVYLYGYMPPITGDKLSSTSQAFRTDADFVIQVQFVDGPARAFDASRDDMVFDLTLNDTGDRDGSTLRAGSPAVEAANQDVDMDGYFDGMYTILADDDGRVTVTAAVLDGKNQPLNAGASGSSVAFQVNYTDGSSLIPGRVSYSSGSIKIAQGTNVATHMVGGWKETGAVKVTVSATYTGPGAATGFDLGTITLSRVGPLNSVMATSCADDMVEGADTTTDDGCMSGYNPQMRYGAMGSFAIDTMTTDALGSAITAETTTRVMPATAMSWWNSLDCAGMNAAVPADSTPAPGTDSTLALLQDVRRPGSRRQDGG